MRKLKICLGLSVAVIAVSIALTGLVDAHVFRTGENVTIDQSQKIEHTLFASGKTVNIGSEVYGDVFCGGQTVTITGIVHGDVICAGQTVSITGNVDGDVRLAGQTVTIGASVKGNATIASQSFIVEPGGVIAGDVTLGSGDGTFNGTVGRDIAVSSGHVIINGKVGREVRGNIENLELSSGAQIGSNINFTSQKEIVKAEGATIGGTVTRNDVSAQDKSQKDSLFAFSIGWFIYWFLAMMLIAMILAFLFPRLLQAVTNRAVPRPWKALLVGFLAGIAVPVILIVLAITTVGIPLALIVGLVWLVIVLLSGPFSGYYLGRLILKNSRNPLLIMLAGGSVLSVVYFIPFIGFIAIVLALWTGSGMILLELFRRTPRPTYNLASPTIVPAKKKKA